MDFKNPEPIIPTISRCLASRIGGICSSCVVEVFLSEVSIAVTEPSDHTKAYSTVLEDNCINVLSGNVYFSGILRGGARVERTPH